MNVTPGFYQRDCCQCSVSYLPKDYEENNCYQMVRNKKEKLSCSMIICEKDYLDLLKLELGKLDKYW